MKIINNIFRYIGYFTVSGFIGLGSYLSEDDFLQDAKMSIFAILVTATVLTTTLTNILISELFKKRPALKDVHPVILELRRNTRIEIGLLVLTFMFFVLSGFFTKFTLINENIFQVLQNGLLVFDFSYFILVLWDEIDGWYKLITNE